MKSSKKLFFGKTILITSITAIVLTLVLVYFTGLKSHRSITDNAFISLSILGASFFLFLLAGLFYGFDVQDDLKNKLRFRWGRSKRLIPINWSFEVPNVMDADGPAGCLAAIVFWIVATLAAILLVIALEVFVWGFVIVLIAAIYWVLIRALKLIFAKSAACKDNLLKSAGFALAYTALYIGWIYGVIYISTLF